ncbi:MAG: hypothetical protein AUJ71_03985 [Candidatus Omnitrophica bacterium CG1_02_49_16]|nr:MAG: hypothetical protein AUJ71_03985 [Candidatus Omnitrophica bacterium CG1_02_49_16]
MRKTLDSLSRSLSRFVCQRIVPADPFGVIVAVKTPVFLGCRNILFYALWKKNSKTRFKINLGFPPRGNIRSII